MLDRLFALISTFFDYFKFWWIIEQYNKGVLLRFGKFVKVLEPGLHFKIPFADFAVETIVVPSTMRLYHQSLHTKDDKSLVIQAIVKYQVSDVQTLLLKVYDPIDAIGDMTQAIIKNVIMERTWEECRDPEIDNLITKKARVEARKWGLDIISVILVDFAKVPSIRLITNPATSPID